MTRWWRSWRRSPGMGRTLRRGSRRSSSFGRWWPASGRRRTSSAGCTRSVLSGRPKAWSLDHFREWSEWLVWPGGERKPLEDWQLAIVGDIFKGFRETWLVLPEGNGKSTLVAILGLYGADFSSAPWIPVGAASAKQARIVF